jgi:hypothetical protein
MSSEYKQLCRKPKNPEQSIFRHTKTITEKVLIGLTPVVNL